MSWLRQLVLGLFKVPAEPQPPPGSAAALRVFRASPRFFEYSVLGWMLKQAGALVGLVISFATIGIIDFAGIEPFVTFESLETVLLGAAALFYLVQLPASFLMLRFGYEMRWYMVSDRALRIREGIFKVREQTMTVANIQNMSVRQGPLQKLFGIADLEVRTAGGGRSRGKEEGSQSASLHRGVLRGLGDAWEVRDLLRAALGRHRDSGLGDPDEDHETEDGEEALARTAPEGGPSDLLAAAETLLAEARALRREWVGDAGAP